MKDGATIKTRVIYDENEEHYAVANVRIRYYHEDDECEVIETEIIEGEESDEFTEYLNERKEDLFWEAYDKGDTEEQIERDRYDENI